MNEDIFHFSIQELLRAALVFLRISGILFALPIFGEQPTPVRVRLLLAGAIAVGLYHLVPTNWGVVTSPEIISFGLTVVKEMLIGLFLGFIAKIVFEGILLASSLVGFQMGFGTASLMFPQSDQETNGFTAMHRAIVMLIFLTLNLHHLFIQAIADSFHLIPAGAAIPRVAFGAELVKYTAAIFTIAVQMSAPVLIALLFTMAALGIMARTVPQLNVFTMSFPASFTVGLLVYIAVLPMFPDSIAVQFGKGHEYFLTVMRALAPVP